MIERTPMINTITLVEQLNAILELLEARGVEILDWENPDARLTHVEYHRADGIRGGRVVEGAGDKSDNLYCFFE